VARKHGLGKGLDALLPLGDEKPPGSPVEQSGRAERDGSGFAADPVDFDGNNTLSAAGANPGGAVLLISPDLLQANPDQPRKNFDETELDELAASIREHGIISPVIAETAGDGTYIIIAGERRTRAARLAGLAEVPVILRDYSDEKRMEVSLIENVQRAGLNPIEEAAAYKKLMELTGLSQDEVAAKVGKNRSTVANALRLLKLPTEIRAGLEGGNISPGHARAILAVNGVKNQILLFKAILAGGLSVREAEKRAAAQNAPEKDAPGRGTIKGVPRRPPEINAMEEKFIGRLGTKVVIEGDLNRGRIRIDYYSMEDLERLYEILGG
jgi:ParB family chromosome partitioning protein